LKYLPRKLDETSLTIDSIVTIDPVT